MSKAEEWKIKEGVMKNATHFLLRGAEDEIHLTPLRCLKLVKLGERKVQSYLKRRVSIFRKFPSRT